jgi:hypothetical protein
VLQDLQFRKAVFVINSFCSKFLSNLVCLLKVESLAKKYEEKYKQVGEIASKLAIEEAAIRDIHVSYFRSETSSSRESVYRSPPLILGLTITLTGKEN